MALLCRHHPRATRGAHSSESPPPRGCPLRPLREELPWRHTHKEINPPCWVAFSQKQASIAARRADTPALLARRFATAPRLLTKRPERHERWLPPLRSLPGVSFESSTEKTSLERAAGFSRLAQDEAILFLALSQKRVLKFKPRGAGLPSSPLGEEPPSPFLTVLSQSVSWQARTTMISPPLPFFLFFFLLSSFPSLFSSLLTRLLSASPEVFPNCAESSGNSGSARRGGQARRPGPRAAGRSLWPRCGGTRRAPTSAGPWAKRPGLWGAAGSAPPRSLSNSRKKLGRPEPAGS